LLLLKITPFLREGGARATGEVREMKKEKKKGKGIIVRGKRASVG
jgi:hypothetical protein